MKSSVRPSVRRLHLHSDGAHCSRSSRAALISPADRLIGGGGGGDGGGWGLFPSLTLRMGFHPSAKSSTARPAVSIQTAPPGVQKGRPPVSVAPLAPEEHRDAESSSPSLPVIHEEEKKIPFFRLFVFSACQVNLTFCLFLFLPPRRPTLRKTWTSPADQVNKQMVVLFKRCCLPFARGDGKKTKRRKRKKPKKRWRVT